MGQIDWRPSSTAAGQGPIVEVTHRCPDTIPTAQEPIAVAYPMSWTLLDETFNAAASLPLSTLMPELTEQGDWPAILLRILPADTGASHILQIESHTDGVLMTYPLNEQEGQYTFQHAGPEGDFTGTITPSGDGLSLSLSEGTIHTTLGDIPLAPFSINLPKYPNASAQ